MRLARDSCAPYFSTRGYLASPTAIFCLRFYRRSRRRGAADATLAHPEVKSPGNRLEMRKVIDG